MTWYGFIDENSYTNVRDYFTLIPNSEEFSTLSNSSLRTYLSSATKYIDNYFRDFVSLRDDYEYKLDNSNLVFPIKDELELDEIVIETTYKLAFQIFNVDANNDTTLNIKRERVDAKNGEYEIEFGNSTNKTSSIKTQKILNQMIKKYEPTTPNFYWTKKPCPT